MKTYRFVLILLVSVLPVLLLAQTPRKKKGVGFNMDKIELVYRNIEVTKTYSNGNSHSYNTAVPQLRINNGVPVDFKAATLLPYLKQCPKARKEIKLFDKKIKQSRKTRWAGFLAGSGIAVTGLLTTAYMSSKGKESFAPFGIGFGLGIGTFVYGVIKSRKHKKEAIRHMENTVSLYNHNCYKPQQDETASGPTAVDQEPSKLGDGIQHNYKDTVLYKILENDPEKYSFAAANLIFLDIEGANYHGFTYRSGLSFNLHKTSKFYTNAAFKIALVDNLSSSSDKGTGGFNQNPTIEPVKYQKAYELSVVSGVEFFGKNHTVKEQIYLGRDAVYGKGVDNYTNIESKRRVSWSFRAGASVYRSVLYSESGLPYATSEAPRTELLNPVSGETITMYFDDLQHGLAMLNSTSISAGISRRVIRNLKVEVLNNRFKGKKRNSFVSAFYADVLYAPKLTIGDIRYQYNEPNYDQHYSYTIAPDATAIRKIGWRAGYRIYSAKGLDFQLEAGQRPGMTESMGYFSLTGMYSLGREF